MIKNFLSVLFLLLALGANGQKYVSEKSSVTFFSEATIEDISAKNSKATSILDAQTLSIAFSVPVREFQFDKGLMQQHFNEKYLESDKYPRSTFSGKIIGFSNSFTGVKQVSVQGKLVIHGVTKEVEIIGTIEVTPKTAMIKSKFIVKLEDFKIKIPQLMWQNIAEEVEVTVEFNYKLQ